MVKNPPACRRPGSDPGVAAHSSVLACRIPETEGPGGLQSMGSHIIIILKFSFQLKINRFTMLY